MYISIALRLMLLEHGWFLGEKPGRFKLLKSENLVLGIVPFGGDRGIRTPNLGDANAALSQLSYIPVAFRW